LTGWRWALEVCQSGGCVSVCTVVTVFGSVVFCQSPITFPPSKPSPSTRRRANPLRPARS
jgi:hypothetical protein